MREQTDHALTHRGHTPLGTAHTTASVNARGLTATATNHRALRARDGHTPVQRRLCVRKERLSGVAVLPQPCPLCGSPEDTPVHMHVGCAHSRLGGARGGPPPPARGQSPVGGLVGLLGRRVDGSLLLWAGARGGGGAAPRHSPLRPAKRDLCGRFPQPHALARRFCMGASQPLAGATPPRAPKRGGPGAPMAHRGRGQLPPPPCALARTS